MNCFRLLYSPKSAFERIRAIDKPKWGWDFLVVGVFFIMVTYLSMPINDKVTELTMQQVQQKMQNMSPEIQEQFAKQMDSMGSTSIVSTLIAAPVTYLFAALLWAAFLFGGISIFKGQTSFVKVFALTLASYIVMVIGVYVNSVLVILVKGVENINDIYAISVIGLNSLFSQNEVGAFGYAFLSKIDPFTIWYLLLLAFGASHISGINLRKSLGTTIVTWLIFTLFSASMAAVMALFQS